MSSIHQKAVDLVCHRERPLIFDVGANQGGWTREFLAGTPARNLHMVEPLPALAAKLRAEFDDARVHELVLTDHEGSLTFHVGNFTPVSSMFPRNQEGRRYYDPKHDLPHQVERDCTTLDILCAGQQIDHIDLLKLDTQGAEATILRGAAGLLGRGAIDVVLTEFFCVPHYEGGALMFDIWKELDKAGYSMFDFKQDMYAPNGQLRFGDAIFLSPAMRAGI